MIRPRWRKIARDLGSNPSRTLLVVLSIAIGVMIFGAIFTVREVISRELRQSFLKTNPLSAALRVEPPFDDELVAAAARVPGVAAAEGQRQVGAQIRDRAGSLRDIALFVLPDNGVTAIGQVQPEAGVWPPPRHALVIERSGIAKTGAVLGETIIVELPGAQARPVPIVGLSYDLSLPPAPIAGQAFGYLTSDTLAWLGGPSGYNQLKLVVSEGRDDRTAIAAVAHEVAQLVERSGRDVVISDIPTPLQHPIELLLPTIILILSLLGSLALVVSGFLIINTISAILAAQTRQIGIMKALGASEGQLIRLYLSLAAAFGVLALAVAIPGGIALGTAMSRFLAGQLNLDLSGIAWSAGAIGLQCAAAILVPVLAAAVPVRAAVRRTVREALAGPSEAPPPSGGLVGAKWLSRPLRLTLRNTLRRRGRLVRTLIALALGGAVFIGVISLRSALSDTLERSISGQRYDIEVLLSRPEPPAQIAALIGNAPSIEGLAFGRGALAYPVRSDASTGEGVQLRAVSPGDTTIQPLVASGRWLLPADQQAIVLSTNIWAKEPGLGLGDWVTLTINDQVGRWRVVGFTEEFIPPVSPAIGYVSLEAFGTAFGAAGRADVVRVTTSAHNEAAHEAAAQQIDQLLTPTSIEVRQIHSRSQDRAILYERFNLLTAILSILAALIAIVGGLGLMGTMSINVIERAREIGVMRAIGAGDGTITRLVLGEGLMIGVLAWGAAGLIALPLSRAMQYGIGMALLSSPLDWRYSWLALGFWLLMVLIVAVVASLLPARAATRITVREALAYE